MPDQNIRDTINRPQPVPYTEQELSSAFRTVCRDNSEMKAVLAQTAEALDGYMRHQKQFDMDVHIGLESLYNAFFKEEQS